MDKKIGTWKGKWLTKVGKVAMSKVALSALPTYQLSCLPLNLKKNKKIEEKLRNFFWNDMEEQKKMTLIKWDNISNPKELGGLGIKKLNWQNEAFGAKLV